MPLACGSYTCRRAFSSGLALDAIATSGGGSANPLAWFQSGSDVPEPTRHVQTTTA